MSSHLGYLQKWVEMPFMYDHDVCSFYRWLGPISKFDPLLLHYTVNYCLWRIFLVGFGINSHKIGPSLIDAFEDSNKKGS